MAPFPASISDVSLDYTYLDYAASTPLIPEAIAAMEPFLKCESVRPSAWANPNSLHRAGRAAFAALEDARHTFAEAIGAKRPQEAIFCSGATEADNLAIKGIAHAALEKRRLQGKAPKNPRIIVSAIEHDAVLAPAKSLEAQGFQVDYLAPDSQGFIYARTLENELDDNVLLVSVQMVNSEIGSVQPVEELAACAHAAGALFHTDATQALGKTYLDVSALGVDAASFSAHKIGGPKGVGALYLKARTPCAAATLGGGQEGGMRSGTQNVAGACGFAAAAQVAQATAEDESGRLRHLRDYLYASLDELPEWQPTVEVEPESRDFAPHIVHGLLHRIESETAILRLDGLGFAVSGGSACSSHSLDVSHVLRAIGIPTDAARGALRISLGRFTTADDLVRLVHALAACADWRN